MEQISLLFYAIASLVGVENCRILCEKATVTINPVEKTVTIFQENLFYMAINDEEKKAALEELQLLNKNTDTTMLGSVELNATQLKQINATIKLHYKTPEELAGFGIQFYDGKFSLINIPDWNLKTTDGKLKDNYWDFDAARPFNFSIRAFENIPSQYKSYKTSLYEYWEKIKK